jgi:hypothetical protein
MTVLPDAITAGLSRRLYPQQAPQEGTPWHRHDDLRRQEPTMTINRRRRGGILAVLLAGLLGATLAAPAMAFSLPGTPPATTSGKVGPHRLVDTESSPGAICHYPTTPNYVSHIHIEPPVARARMGHSSQRIGFRYVIQGWNGSKFVNAQVSGFQMRTATPTTNAAFTGRTVKFRAQDDDLFDYRVRVDLRWYSSSGKVVGKAHMWVHDYLIQWTGNPDAVVQDWCGDTTG